MMRTAVFLTILLSGCSAMQQAENPVMPPELVTSAALPLIPSVVPGGGMRFNVEILVRKDGTVGDVKLLQSSGDPDWDSLALRSIRKWLFDPARRDGTPVELWVRQPLLVQLRDPIIRTLAALESATQQEADSLYSLVEHGADFDSLQRQAELVQGERSRSPGSVDISMFAPRLRDKLLKLRDGEVSPPLRIGSRFIMYKRLKKEPA
jgi:protein TonB